MVFLASSKVTNISCRTFPMRSHRCAQLWQPSKVSSHSHLFLQRSDRQTRLDSGNGSTDFTRTTADFLSGLSEFLYIGRKRICGPHQPYRERAGTLNPPGL